MPKGLPWFRMYSEFAFDPKIQSMSETLQRRYAMFLCLKCNGDIPGLTNETAACALRISLNDLLETKKILISVGLIGNNFEINNWDKRQYRSDSSTPRVKLFRSKKLNNKCETLQKRYRNGNVTALSVSVSESTSNMFLSFWKEYPKKANKKNAEKAFIKIKPDKELFEKIMVALKWQRQAWHDPKFTPHAATWLNGNRWEDEKESAPKATNERIRPNEELSPYEQIMLQLAEIDGNIMRKTSYLAQFDGMKDDELDEPTIEKIKRERITLDERKAEFAETQKELELLLTKDKK